MKIECPYADCRQRIEIDIEQAGIEAMCPTCNRPFTCPSLDDVKAMSKSGASLLGSNAKPVRPANKVESPQIDTLPFVIRFYGHVYWIAALAIAIVILFSGGGIVGPTLVLGIGAVFQRMGWALAHGSKQAAYGAWVMFLFVFALPVWGAVSFASDRLAEKSGAILLFALMSFGVSFLLFGIPAVMSIFHWKKFK